MSGDLWRCPDCGHEGRGLASVHLCRGKILPSDAVDHPAHYGGADNPYEAIKVIEAWGLGFNLGNTVKYIGRANHKGATIQDLEKAAWYLARQIGNLKAANGPAQPARGSLCEGCGVAEGHVHNLACPVMAENIKRFGGRYD